MTKTGTKNKISPLAGGAEIAQSVERQTENLRVGGSIPSLGTIYFNNHNNIKRDIFMCGIIGYVGKRNVLPILMEGLKKLEYRGYDSAGVAVLSQGELKIVRSVGKISSLEAELEKQPLTGNIGVGHSRWATHGKPSEENAHPHTDCHQKLVIVHNGIIENYLSLKKELEEEGHIIKSETDTEIIAHLIEKYLESHRIVPFTRVHLYQAVQKALARVRGSYALGVLYVGEPDVLVAARKESPLIIGLGKWENFIASDVPAIISSTRRIIHLEDGDIAILSPDGVDIYDQKGKKIERKISEVRWNAEMAEKAGYPHFMLKEIIEQPQAIEETLRGRICPDSGEIILDELNLDVEQIKKIKRIIITGCGTSWHAGLVGEYILEDFCRIPTEVEYASEFRYRDPVVGDDTLIVAISQSGETADTIAAVNEAKSLKANIVSICNVVGSSITRYSNGVIYTHAGPEIGVASTKAFTCQLVVLYLLGLYLGRIKGSISLKEIQDFIMALRRIPHQIRELLNDTAVIEEISEKLYQKTNALYLGRGKGFPVALEGALKLKEVSYIHAEGYPAAEMKHGPIALIDKNMPVFVLAFKGRRYEKILGNVEEVKARGGIVIAIASTGDELIKEKADYTIFIPESIEVLTPLLAIVPLQLLAYHIAVKRGCNVDQPRNLAKSVTVE